MDHQNSICNIFLYFLPTISRWSSSIRHRYLPVPIILLFLLNIVTLSQATDSKLIKCSEDDTLIEFSNCSSDDCVYGKETWGNCTLPANDNIKCEVK